MSRKYITEHFQNIKNYANVIEQRLDDSDFTLEEAIKSNEYALEQCQRHKLPYHLIDTEYNLNTTINV